jgi:hypothetical protein
MHQPEWRVRIACGSVAVAVAAVRQPAEGPAGRQCPASRTVVGVSEVLPSAGWVPAAVRVCGPRFFALDPAEP